MGLDAAKDISSWADPSWVIVIILKYFKCSGVPVRVVVSMWRIYRAAGVSVITLMSHIRCCTIRSNKCVLCFNFKITDVALTNAGSWVMYNHLMVSAPFIVFSISTHSVLSSTLTARFVFLLHFCTICPDGVSNLHPSPWNVARDQEENRQFGQSSQLG